MNMPQQAVYVRFKRISLLYDGRYYLSGDNCSEELKMALNEVYDLMYIADRQCYTEINERWGIGRYNDIFF
jgi:hypothetical protein